MTGGFLAGRLEALGLDGAEAERKRGLLDAAAAAFPPFADGPPTHAWWIPGRLEVFGKHTDYAGGRSLVGTVPRGFGLLARARRDGRIRILDARRAQELVLEPPFSASSFTGWRHYAHTVARRLHRNFPGASLGADIVLASDLPSASGMSSSSALVVGLVVSLVELADLRARDEWRDNVHGPPDEAGYYACFENGLSFGTLEGDGGVGTHGGSEDHIAIVCGGASRLSAWRFVPIQPIGGVELPAAWAFVIAASGVPAQKTGAAREAYNRLSERVRSLLQRWNAFEPAQPSLSAAMASSPSAPDRLREILAAGGPDPRAGELRMRLDHFLREDARVLDALAAFRRADRQALAALSAASQEDAEALLRNQIAETSVLARRARDLGAFAASAFGAGFGGSVWALVNRGAAQAFAGSWLADYLEQFPERSGATAFVATPGPPLSRLV